MDPPVGVPVLLCVSKVELLGGRGGNECEGCVGPDVGDFSNML
jgi:hypothetical protein